MEKNMEGREGPGAVSGRRSSVWQHFIRSKDGDGKDIATCKRCERPLGADTRNGTNHLNRHVAKCNPQKRPRPPSPSAQDDNPESSRAHHRAKGSCRSFNQEEDCGGVDELARMIAFHGYPSSIVEDECFRSFVSVLSPHFQMPSRAAIEGICRLRAKEAMDQLKETLQSNQGQISLATGTSPTVQGSALYMVWQFIDDEWTLQKRIAQVFSVVPFPPYHHDTLLGSNEVSIELDEGILELLSCATTTPTLKEAVERWVLPDRIFSVAWGEELEKHLEHKDFLNDLCSENQVSDVPQVFRVTYISDVLNSVADSIFSKLDNSFVEGCFKAVKALALSQEQRDQILSDLGLKRLGRYDRRWFSYYCALELLKHSAGSVVEEQEFNASRIGEQLRRSRHTNTQLRELLGPSRFKQNILTELLRKILGMIYHALVAISLPKCCPTSNICLQELMKLKKALRSDEADYTKCRGFARDNDVVGALEEAQGVVDKFLKESSLYLSIPAVLDPRLKMKHIRNIFKDVFEKPEDRNCCIEKVRQRMQCLFDEQGRRKCHNISGEGTSSSAEARTGTSVDSNWHERIVDLGRYMQDSHMDSGADDDGSLDYLQWLNAEPRTGTSADSISDESINELQRYLQDSHLDSREGDDDGSFDILQWWKTNECRYPTVARMARDALAMPASDILTPEDASAVRSMVSWLYGNQ